MAKFPSFSFPKLSLPKLRNFQLTPTAMGWLMLLFGLIFASLVYYPIHQIFIGEWKLNQQIELFTLDSINIFGFSLPIGVIAVRFYALCILIGLLSGYTMTLFLSKFHYIAGTVVDRLFIGFVIFGLLGSRLFFVLFNLDKFSANYWEVLTGINHGGLAIFGSIIASLIYLWIYCKRFKFNFYEFLDFIVPGLLLGQIFGRFGNFFNYEAYGQPTAAFWKMYVPPTASGYSDNINEHFFHPTFLYEIIPNFLLLVFILFRYKKFTHKHAGLIAGTYMVGYGLIRAITEVFRIDALYINLPQFLQLKIGPFKVQNLPDGKTGEFGPFVIESLLVSQLAAIALLLLGLWILSKRLKVLYIKKTARQIQL